MTTFRINGKIQTAEQVQAYLASLTGDQPAKGKKSKPTKAADAKTQKAEKVAAPTDGKFKRTAATKELFNAHKRAGLIPWLTTQQEAFDAGLIDHTGKITAMAKATAKSTPKKSKGTKKARTTAGEKGGTSFGKTLATITKTSGLWVKEQGSAAESLYTVALHTRWEDMNHLRADGMTAKDAMAQLLVSLEEEGAKVGKASEVKWASKARAAKQAAREAAAAARNN